MPQGPNTQPEGPRKYLRGALSLFVTAGLVVVLFIWLPAYRWFFLGSLAIGVIVAAILFFGITTGRSKKKTSKTSARLDSDDCCPALNVVDCFLELPLARSQVNRQTDICASWHDL